MRTFFAEFFSALRDGLLFRRRHLSGPAYLVLAVWLLSWLPLALRWAA